MRYLRLYMYFLQFSFSRAMEFRVDFFFRIIMDIIFYVTYLAFYQVIFMHTSTLGGWSEEETLVFISAYFLVDALNMTVFSTNLWWFPILINKGDLDYYLVRPVSTLFFLSVREFAANSLCNIFIAVGIFLWALSNYQASIFSLKTTMFFLLIINGTFLHYVMHMLFLVVVFWTHSARGFDNIFNRLTLTAERPDGIFSGWTRRILTTILPFCLIVSLPSQLFFREFDLVLFSYIIMVTFIMFLFLLIVWKWALKSYTSASS